MWPVLSNTRRRLASSSHRRPLRNVECLTSNRRHCPFSSVVCDIKYDGTNISLTMIAVQDIHDQRKNSISKKCWLTAKHSTIFMVAMEVLRIKEKLVVCTSGQKQKVLFFFTGLFSCYGSNFLQIRGIARPSPSRPHVVSDNWIAGAIIQPEGTWVLRSIRWDRSLNL